MNAVNTLFKTSVGPSERSWHNLSMGTYNAVVCELCGTEWPEITGARENSYSLGSFLGRQFVEECCGKVVDRLYSEFGEEFARAFLKDFAESPMDSRFFYFRFMLKETLPEIQRHAGELVQEMKTEQDMLQ